MAFIPFIDLGLQYRSIQPEIDSAIQKVIFDSAFIEGPYVLEFEKAYSQYCGLPYGVGTSSGTTALHLAFESLGIGPGDEVITVPNTFIATVETISQTGAKTVFVDVLDETLNMDPEKLEPAITRKTRAIVPVHLYGQMADMEKIQEVARMHNLMVIEDAAQAQGADYKKKRAGHFGIAATFSFYPGKILGAYGDAGMVVTSNHDLAQKMEMLANHGRLNKYTHQMPGYNYRMDGLQGAILGVKLKHLENWIQKRRENAQIYTEFFEKSAIRTPVESDETRHVYTYYVIRTSKRDGILKILERSEIEAIIHYPTPLHLQPAYEHLGYREGDFPVAECAARQILSLPIFPELEHFQIQRIAELVCRV